MRPAFGRRKPTAAPPPRRDSAAAHPRCAILDAHGQATTEPALTSTAQDRICQAPPTYGAVDPGDLQGWLDIRTNGRGRFSASGHRRATIATEPAQYRAFEDYAVSGRSGACAACAGIRIRRPLSHNKERTTRRVGH